MWDFNSIKHVFSYDTRKNLVFFPHIDHQKLFLNLYSRHIGLTLDIDKVPRWDENFVIHQSD